MERLRNEITRLTTVKALTKVASSPLRIDLRPIMVSNLQLYNSFLLVFFFNKSMFQFEAVPILGSFLRKNQRALKLSTLILLDTLVKNYSTALNADLLNKVKNLF